MPLKMSTKLNKLLTETPSSLKNINLTLYDSVKNNDTTNDTDDLPPHLKNVPNWLEPVQETLKTIQNLVDNGFFGPNSDHLIRNVRNIGSKLKTLEKRFKVVTAEQATTRKERYQAVMKSKGGAAILLELLEAVRDVLEDDGKFEKLNILSESFDILDEAIKELEGTVVSVVTG